jgi:tripartite-type tricarboxylate transporter receptor subunit TctC
MHRFDALVAYSFGAALMFSNLAPNASAREFYEGKTISIFVGSAPGGSYDLYARLVANHIHRYIPGQPAVIVRNMPGAGSLTMAHHLAQAAPSDGTAVGAPLNTLPLSQILASMKMNLDVAKFSWIGSIASPTNVLATWHTSGVKSVDDAKKKEVLIGATSVGTSQSMYPLLSNAVLQTKFRVISGYKGGADVNLAMERGEVHGRGANTYLAYRFQNAEWIRDEKLHFLFQMTFHRDKAIPNIPTLLELTPADEDKRIVSILTATETIGRAFFAPFGIPTERVELLRRALINVAIDEIFLSDARKSQLDVDAVPGEKIQSLVQELASTPAKTLERFKQAIAE